MTDEVAIVLEGSLEVVTAPLRKRQRLCLMWMLLLGAKEGKIKAGVGQTTVSWWRRKDPTFAAVYGHLLQNQQEYAHDAFVMLAENQGIRAVEQFASLNELPWDDCPKHLVSAKMKVGEFFANRILPLIERKESFSYEQIVHEVRRE